MQVFCVAQLAVCMLPGTCQAIHHSQQRTIVAKSGGQYQRAKPSMLLEAYTRRHQSGNSRPTSSSMLVCVCALQNCASLQVARVYGHKWSVSLHCQTCPGQHISPWRLKPVLVSNMSEQSDNSSRPRRKIRASKVRSTAGAVLMTNSKGEQALVPVSFSMYEQWG